MLEGAALEGSILGDAELEDVDNVDNVDNVDCGIAPQEEISRTSKLKTLSNVS